MSNLTGTLTQDMEKIWDSLSKVSTTVALWSQLKRAYVARTSGRRRSLILL